MKWIVVALLLINSSLAGGMEIKEDPRLIISFMDKSLSPELDILRVMTDLSQDNDLVFNIQTRGEFSSSNNNDYLLLQILQEREYIFLFPINKSRNNELLVYESAVGSKGNNYNNGLSGDYVKVDSFEGFKASLIRYGVSFSIPINWIDFNSNLSFDVFTVHAQFHDNQLQLHKVYDQARRRDGERKFISAITFLNKLCSPKR